MDAVIDRAQVGALGHRLGAGGQATVYLAPRLRLPDAPGDLVYKEYKAGQRPPGGLASVAARRSQLTPEQRDRLDSSATWPLRVVRDGSDYCGVVMRLIPDGFFQQRILPGSGRSSRDLREVQNLFVDARLAARVGMPFPGPRERWQICRDFASALHLVHSHGLVVGDINARNAVFRLEARPTVMLVDCDAVRIRGSAPVVAQLNAPDWDPPEGPSRLTQETDRYKFGLFVLRCLAPGAQASVGRDPRAATAVLDDAGQALLVAALSPNGADRPSAQDWGRYLNARLAGRPTTPAPRARPAGEDATRLRVATVPSTGPAPTAPSTPAPTTRTKALRRDPVTGAWTPVTPP